jgi:beta-glucosidase/6-phospho-beta-glucosidase/beta-galactosidase
MLNAANREGLQVIWALCHYGWPDGLNILKPEFIDRLARFASTIARVVKDSSDQVPFYTPVNEISFLAWGGSRDFMFPFAIGRDNELKYQLVRATIAACEAIWDVDARARFVYPEPVVHVVPPTDRPDLARDAQRYEEAQYEAWDMLAGRLCPSLGGSPKYLDVIGLNYYHSNQWEHTKERLRWEDEPRDPRWKPFHLIVEEAWRRYENPLIISETSHFGAGRARWIREIADEVAIAMKHGVPVGGLCLYPILDRYDWQDVNHWHNSGLFDLVRQPDGCLKRVLNKEYATALREAQQLIKRAM